MDYKTRSQRRQEKFQQIDLKELAEKRHAFAVELRRQKRELRVKKRRAQMSSNQMNLLDRQELFEVPLVLKQNNPQLNNSELSLSEKLSILKDMLAASPPEVKSGVLDTLLCFIEANTNSLKCFVQANLVPLIRETAEKTQDLEVRLLCFAMLANVFTLPRDEILEIYDVSYIRLLQSGIKDSKTFSYAILGLANLGHDSSKFRRDQINSGVLQELVEFMEQATGEEAFENLGFFLFVLLREAEVLPLDSIHQMLQWIKVLISANNNQLTKDCLYSLKLLTSFEEAHITLVIDNNLDKVALGYLKSQDLETLRTSICVLGNIMGGTDKQTQIMLENGVLDKLMPIVDHSDRNIRTKVFWALSNLTAGTKTQIKKFVNHGILKLCIEGLVDQDLKVRKECAYMVLNLLKEGLPKDKMKLLEVGVMDKLRTAMDELDSSYMKDVLDIGFRLLVTGLEDAERSESLQNKAKDTFEESGCLAKLESIIDSCSNSSVFDLAMTIYVEFFSEFPETSSKQLLNATQGEFVFT